MKELRRIFGRLVRNYGKEYAKEAMQNLLYHEVKSGRMKSAESKRILKALEN